jgi:hypothetical protein
MPFEQDKNFRHLLRRDDRSIKIKGGNGNAELQPGVLRYQWQLPIGEGPPYGPGGVAVNHSSDGGKMAIKEPVEQNFAGWLAVSGNYVPIKIGDNQILFIAVNEGNPARLHRHSFAIRHPRAQIPAVSRLNSPVIGSCGSPDEVFFNIFQKAHESMPLFFY